MRCPPTANPLGTIILHQDSYFLGIKVSRNQSENIKDRKEKKRREKREGPKKEGWREGERKNNLCLDVNLSTQPLTYIMVSLAREKQ